MMSRFSREPQRSYDQGGNSRLFLCRRYDGNVVAAMILVWPTAENVTTTRWETQRYLPHIV